MSGQIIHNSVREHYGAIASSGGQAGCCDTTGLYNVTLLDGLPTQAVQLSLGCGDPVSIASLKPGDVVLDLGSGGGIDCLLAARQVGPGGYVIGVDMTPAMLDKARQNAASMGVQHVEFRHGQIEALPVADASIDVILSNCVINLSPDKPAVFAEALRVLKPGGRMCLSDIVTEGEFTPALRADLAKWAECVTGALDVQAYVGLIRAAGFEQITVVDKVDAETIVPRQPGMPRVFSARVTAFKPAP
ncbi:MAG: arsenite methyltransferase [Anaerolineae bacterium]|nr:arsenite methyltransferase [Anaerolineae bacterium]